MESDCPSVSKDCNFEIKKIGNTCYRVNSNLNKKYYSKANNIQSKYEKDLLNEFKQKFTDFQNDDDVYSYSGDSDFLKSDDETNKESEIIKKPPKNKLKATESSEDSN